MLTQLKHYSLKTAKLTITFLALLVGAIYLAQDLLVFPGAYFRSSDFQTPKHITSTYITTPDNKTLEVWEYPPENSDRVVVFFHGNGANLPAFTAFGDYFTTLGLKTYTFDYRGFGKSSGAPTETGLYVDTNTVVDYVKDKEEIENNRNLIFVGYSIGSAPAAFAAKNHPGSSLVLYAPFTSIYEAAKQSAFGILRDLLAYSFPTKKFVSTANLNCFLVVHGKEDDIVPYELGVEVFESYIGVGYKKLITPKSTHHLNPLEFSQASVKQELLQNCD